MDRYIYRSFVQWMPIWGIFPASICWISMLLGLNPALGRDLLFGWIWKDSWKKKPETNQCWEYPRCFFDRNKSDLVAVSIDLKCFRIRKRLQEKLRMIRNFQRIWSFWCFERWPTWCSRAKTSLCLWFYFCCSRFPFRISRRARSHHNSRSAICWRILMMGLGTFGILANFRQPNAQDKKATQYHHEYFTCDCLDWDLGRIFDLSWNVWAVTWYDMKMCLLKLPQCCEKLCDVGIWRCQVRHSFDYFGVGCNVEIGNIRAIYVSVCFRMGPANQSIEIWGSFVTIGCVFFIPL